MYELEEICFQLITESGSAKSKYMEALAAAKAGDFEKSKCLLSEGDGHATKCHKMHVDMIQREASGEPAEMNLLLMHAEDQMMNTETIRIFVEELIEIHSSIHQA